MIYDTEIRMRSRSVAVCFFKGLEVWVRWQELEGRFVELRDIE